MEALGRTEEFRRRILEVADESAAHWGPADFIRASQQSAEEFFYGEDRRATGSEGALRFHGAGVIGHTLAMRTAGLAMTAWQKLVTDVYAATEGFRNIRGPLPASVQLASALRTRARALPGSVIFDFSYGHREDAQAGLFESETKVKVDPVAQTLDFLGVAEQVTDSPDADEFVGFSRDIGPRATSSLRSFAELLSSQELDLDATIYPWHGQAKTVRASARAFQAIVSSIDRGQVLYEKEVLKGELISLSSRKQELEIKPSDDEYVRVSATNVDLRPFSIGQFVKIYATSKWKTSATGEATVTYDAHAIEGLGWTR